MGSQIKSHINRISLAREEGDEADLLGQEEVTQEATGEGWPRFKGKFRGARGGFPRRGRFQGRKFDKSPTTKRPRVSGKAEDKDKD